MHGIEAEVVTRISGITKSFRCSQVAPYLNCKLHVFKLSLHLSTSKLLQAVKELSMQLPSSIRVKGIFGPEMRMGIATEPCKILFLK